MSSAYTDNADLLALLWEDKETGLETYDAWTAGNDPVCPFYIGSPVDGVDGAYYVYHLHGGDLSSATEAAGRGWLKANMEGDDGWLNDDVVSQTVTADANTETLSDLPFGYYMITTTTGSTVTVNSTTPDVTVYDKNSQAPENPVKTEDKVYVTDADVVTYTSTLDVTNYLNSANNHNAIFEYLATDSWDAGLTFDEIVSVKLFQWVEDEDMTAEDYAELTDAEKAGYKVETVGEGEEATTTYYAKEYSQAFTEVDEVEKSVDAENANVVTYTANNKFKYTLTTSEATESAKAKFVISLPWASFTVTSTTTGETTSRKVSDLTNFYTTPATLEIVYKMTVNDKIFDNQKNFKADNTMAYTYAREVNGTPVVGGGENPQTVTVYSIGFSLRKTDLGGANLLEGAKFIVYKDVTSEGDNPVTTRYYYTCDKASLEYDDDNKAIFDSGSDNHDYDITWISADDYEDIENGATAEEQARADATRLTADNSYETMEIIGLTPGTYYIEEVAAPSGYNLPANAFIVTIEPGTTEGKYVCTYSKNGNTEGIEENNAGHNQAYNTVEIENNTNAAMPSTGGAGTFALVTCGAIAFLGTAVVLVTKKRMYNVGE